MNRHIIRDIFFFNGYVRVAFTIFFFFFYYTRNIRFDPARTIDIEIPIYRKRSYSIGAGVWYSYD